MAELIDLWKEGTLNDAWGELDKLNFSKKTSSKWSVQRITTNEFLESEETLSNQPSTIIVHGDGVNLISFQNDLENIGAFILTTVNINNLFHNYIVISLNQEAEAEDVSDNVSSDETSTENSNDQSQP